MPRWFTITRDHLKAAGHGMLVDRAGTAATGAIDPVDDAIESITAEVRLAVSAGNALDVDATKIPLSLKKVAVQLVLFALMDRITLALSDDEKKDRERHEKRLNQFFERKIIVEAPDEAATSSVPPNRGSWNSERKILGRTHPVPPPGRQYPPGGAYANPDAPTDSIE